MWWGRPQIFENRIDFMVLEEYETILAEDWPTFPDNEERFNWGLSYRQMERNYPLTFAAAQIREQGRKRWGKKHKSYDEKIAILKQKMIDNEPWVLL